MIESFTIKKGSAFFEIGDKENITYQFSEPDNENEGSGLNVFVGANGTGKTNFIALLLGEKTNGQLIQSCFKDDGCLSFVPTIVNQEVIVWPANNYRIPGTHEENPIPNKTYDDPDRGLKEETTGIINKRIEYYADGFGGLPCPLQRLSGGERRQGKFRASFGVRGPNAIYILDEPEQQLSPHIQKIVFKQLLELSKTNQVIIVTHSPYFVDWESIKNGATVFRFSLTDKGERKVSISSICSSDIEGIGFITDRRSSYKSGIESREFFFLDDCVFLVEGQDDVFYYNNLFEQLGFFSGRVNFFGYGASGVTEIPKLVALLNKLNYKKIIAIADKFQNIEHKNKFDSLRTLYPNFMFFEVPAFDIRKDTEISGVIYPGLCEKSDAVYVVRKEFCKDWNDIADKIREYIVD